MSFSRGPEDWTRWVLEGLLKDEEERRSSEDAPDPTGDGERLGNRYVLRKLLGEGATARVHLGWDEELKRAVAIKILRDRALFSATARERFRREARAAGVLSHPNVATIYDVGEEGDRLYLVMEPVDGRPLSDFLETCRDEEVLLDILEKVARGVAAAHACGIVHRDLKPSNVLLTESHEPKVADFGLAHLVDSPVTLTRTGSPLGTPLYMAPEQVAGRVQDISPRTDVYALGVIAYEALTGHRPFTGESEAEVYRKIADDEAAPPRNRNPKLSVQLETIILKALEKDPARRYPTAQEFAEDLRRIREGEPIQARPPSLLTRLAYRARKRRHLLASLATLIVAAGVVAVIAVSGARDADRERETALGAIREQARVSLEAALRLRRAGDLKGVRSFLPPLEAAYDKAVARAGKLAEPDFLMGRMHRALMEDGPALEYQNRALAKDPAYAPALYERIILLSRKWGNFNQIRRPGGGLEGVYEIPDDLRKFILRDSVELERALEAGGPQQVRMGLAHLAVTRAILALHRGDLHQAKERLQEAIQLDPNLEEAWENLARLLWYEKIASTSIEVCQEIGKLLLRATSHDQGYLPYWEELAWVKAWEGLYRANEGEDSLPLFAEAERHAERLIVLAPDRAQSLLSRGSVRFYRAAYLSRRGREPFPAFEAAERDVVEALRLRSDWDEALLWRVRIRVHRMIQRVKRGGDPSDDARKAEEDLARGATERNAPGESYLWRGIIETQRAIHLGSRGEDPSIPLEAADEILTEGLRVQAANPSLWLWRGIVRYQRGLYRQARGENPLEDFAEAQADLDERIRLSQNWPEAMTWRALSQLEVGIYRVSQGEEPLADFAMAEAMFSRVVGHDRKFGEAWAGRGRARLHRGLWKKRTEGGAAGEALFASAVEDLERARSVTPLLGGAVEKDLADARARLDAARKR